MRGLKISGYVLMGLVVLGSLAPSLAIAQTASADQYLAYGNKLYTARNYQQAIQYYNYAAKLNPSNAAAYQGMGYCYYALGNKQYALAYCQKALQLNPNNSQLAQFVSGLQAQAGATAPAAGGMGMAAADPLAQGTALFQQKQYSAAIPYFQQASQQNPNDYRPYYYAGYSYYMMGDAKDAALYFQVANAKQPNASIKAYADRIKASLSPADQQWVDDQTAKYTGMAVASTGAGASKNESVFGFRLLGGMDYVFADPTQIISGATAAKRVSLTGVTPNVIALPGIEPFLQLGQNFEINMGISYLPIGNLSYTWNDFRPANGDNNGGTGYGYKFSYDDTGVLIGLGAKILFGDKNVKGYFGIGGDLAPISMSFSKVPIDVNGNPVTVQADGVTPALAQNGNYSTLAFGGHAKLGVDFYLDKSVALGPWVGFQYLSATNFQSNGNTLAVDPLNGDVAGQDTLHTQALTLDYTSINGGLNLTFSF